MPTPLPRIFYDRSTLIVARELLGKHLVRILGGEALIGRIVEVEAYGGSDDPASHAHRGVTERNRVMFGRPGVAYVYFSYGNHHCLNVVTESEGVPGAVLIRALEPLRGIEVMKRSRGVNDPLLLTSGPGRLTKAMKITLEQNGLDLTLGRELYAAEPRTRAPFEVSSSGRVGVRDGSDKPWRFYVKDNPHVSGRR